MMLYKVLYSPLIIATFRYALFELVTEDPVYTEFVNGAGFRIRTGDLLITNQLLYQLS